jgi:hypothetical protein
MTRAAVTQHEAQPRSQVAARTHLYLSRATVDIAQIWLERVAVSASGSRSTG